MVRNSGWTFDFYSLSDTLATGDLVRRFIDTSCMKPRWVLRDLKTLWPTSGRNGLVPKVLFDPNELLVSEN